MSQKLVNIAQEKDGDDIYLTITILNDHPCPDCNLFSGHEEWCDHKSCTEDEQKTHGCGPCEERQDIADILADDHLNDRMKLSRVLEWQVCSEGWDFVEPYEVGALTGAPMISPDCERNDDHDNKITDIKTVYAYMDYAVYNELDWLLRHGKVTFEGSEVEKKGGEQQ